METRAKAIGKGGEFFYLFPSGGPTYDKFLSPGDLAAAKALHPRLDKQMVDSIHTGHHPYYWGGGAAGLARALFNQPSLQGFELGAANTETNAKLQTQDRAIMEGGDLNDWFNVVDIAGRLHARAASFCMEQGDNSDDGAFHQGMASFLPNMTYLQPPGWVHHMVTSTWQPNALAVKLTAGPGEQAADTHGSSWNDTFSGSASCSDDGKTIQIKLVNNNTHAISVGINFENAGKLLAAGPAAAATFNASVLSAPSLDSTNSVANPNLVAPKAVQVLNSAVAMPAHSFAVIVATFA